MRKMPNNKGFGLILLVIATTIVGILALTAANSFMSQASQTQLRIDQAKAHYLAQAGVMRAIRNWYNTSVNSDIARRNTTLNTTVTGNQIFKVGLESGGVNILQSNYAYVVPGIAFVKNVGLSTENASDANVAVTLAAGVSVPAGNLVIVSIAIDGVVTFATPACADTGLNAYVVRSNVVGPGANSNVSPRTMIISSLLTTALAATNTITCTWTGAVTAKAMSVAEYSGVDTFDAQVTASGTLPGNAINSGNLTTGFANELLIGAVGVEGPSTDTFTAGTNWITAPPTSAENAGAAAAGMAVSPEYRIVSATSATYAATGTNSVTTRDWNSAINGYYATSRWFPSGADRRLRQWQIYNQNSANSLILTKIKVSWTPAGGELLNGFSLNGTSIWPGGTVANGTVIDLTGVAAGGRTLAAATATNTPSWAGSNTYFQWNGAVNGGNPVTVTCQFTFSGDSTTTDSTTQDITMWSGSQLAAGSGMPMNHSKTFTSTGQVNQTVGPNNFKVLKTIKATVSGMPDTAAAPAVPRIEITDWDEGDKNIP